MSYSAAIHIKLHIKVQKCMYKYVKGTKTNFVYWTKFADAFERNA